VVCDDFADDSYIGEAWTADVTNLSNLSSPNATVLWQGTTWQGHDANPSTGIHGGGNPLGEIAAGRLVQSHASGGVRLRDMALTYPSYLPAAKGPSSYLDASTWTTVKNLVDTAVSDVTGAGSTINLNDFSTVTIYSYDAVASKIAGQPTGCGGTCPPPPQEFLIVGMAEPSMPLSLLGYVSALAGLVFVFRKHVIRRV
jgi:hypothetical protein